MSHGGQCDKHLYTFTEQVANKIKGLDDKVQVQISDTKDMLEASIQTIDDQVQVDITAAESIVTKKITEIESALQLQVDELMCARVETDFFTVNE